MNQETDVIKQILRTTRTIAVVGLSADPSKPSHYVSAYMQAAGYRIIPVNPTVSGELLGERVYPDLASIPEPVDLVNVFRRSRECAAVVAQAIAINAKAVWTQLGIDLPRSRGKSPGSGVARRDESLSEDRTFPPVVIDSTDEAISHVRKTAGQL